MEGIQHAPLCVKKLRYSPPTCCCEGCGQSSPWVWHAQRLVYDPCLEGPVLLWVEAGVYRCAICARYFRAQGPFMQLYSSYTRRVVQTAVDAVLRDGMPIRRVAARMARDFWVRPSEASIRRWYRLVVPLGFSDNWGSVLI